MGFFDKVFSENKRVLDYSPKNEQEAWIGILFACVNADDDDSESESDALIKMLTFSSKIDNDSIIVDYKRVLVATRENGVSGNVLVDKCSVLIDDDDKATLFSMAVEIAYANGIIEEEEKDMLEYIAKSLELDMNLAEEIIKVMAIRNKYNYLLD